MIQWLLFFIVIVSGKTVRFSNVPPRIGATTKTYDLEVPGSAPIRIIEAEPLWSEESANTDYKRYKTGKEFTTQPTKTTLSEPSTQLDSDLYSPDALNAFLKNYAERVKADRKKIEVDNAEEETITDEPVNKLASIYLEDKKDDKSKSWGLVDTQKHNHPYEDKKGWVTLEAVPWSTSKISKWQSSIKPKPWESDRNKVPNNWNTKPFPEEIQFNNKIPTNFYGSNNNFNEHRPYDENKHEYRPNNEYRPQGNKYHEYNQNENIFFDKPILTYDANPTSGYSQNPEVHVISRPIFNQRPQSSNYPIELPSKPTWTKPQNWVTKKPEFYPDRPFYNSDDRDIITDNRPVDFPRPVIKPYPNFEQLQNRPYTEENHSENHPPTHPANGNGEWILLSTTKGYQYPRSKHQRALEVTPDSIGTRRGIRLTVLPPEDSNKNMTTSHGGMLEVESSFETVEESHKLFSERLKQGNRTRITHKKKKPMRTQLHVPTHKPKHKRPNTSKKLPVLTSNQDTSAVLAAVGAGMVPATMAMLVPFVTGRKKRSIQSTSVEVQPNLPFDIHL